MKWTSVAYKIAILGLAALGCAESADAAENGGLNYIAGAPGIFIADFPPLPGLFAVSQSSYTSANSLNGADGNRLPVPFKLKAYSETIRLLASYGVNIMGASVYSQLVIPAVHSEMSMYGVEQSSSGFANIVVSPVIFAWHLPNYQQFIVGLDIATPFGTYDPNAFSVAQGYTSFQPGFGYRYNNPQGLDAGATVRFLLNMKNQDTNYKSGTALVVDYMAGWNFGPWKLGVVGGYAYQFDGDRVGGVDIGYRFEEFKVGPSIAYNFGPAIVNLNYQQDVYVKNGAKTGAFWLNIAAPLWVPSDWIKRKSLL